MANKTTQPIKNRKVVQEIFSYMRGKSYRNYMMAKIEFNTARRIGDIIRLKVSDFQHRNGKLREYVTFREEKTGKEAKIVLNKPLKSAIAQYITDCQLEYNDYLFPSRKGYNKPLSKAQVQRIFQDVGQALHLEDFGTHSLRKTWGYFCYKETKNIALIMEVFNHSSEKITLRYIGITQNDKDMLYMNIKF